MDVATVLRMLDTATRLPALGGGMDPLASTDQDPLAIRLYMHLLDQGRFLRSERRLHDLLAVSRLLVLQNAKV